jgi:hypothetical protein
VRPGDEVAQLADLAASQVSSAPALASALAEVQAMPYRFRAADVHVPWSVARQRGFAACGEAAAYLAAAASREGRSVAIELVTGSPAECGAGYRHAVAIVDGQVLDPYAGRACPAPHIPIARRFIA